MHSVCWPGATTRRPRVGAHPVDQRPEIRRDLAPARRTGRQPVQHRLEVLHQASGTRNEIGVQVQQGLIQRGRLIGPHPLEAGKEQLLEDFRL